MAPKVARYFLTQVVPEPTIREERASEFDFSSYAGELIAA